MKGRVLGWVVVSGALGVGAVACKEEPPPPQKGGAPVAGVKLLKAQPIMGAPLTIQMAKNWTFERLEGSDAPEPETPPPGLIDLSETREVWKATGTSPTGRVDPFIIVAVDPRLPKGTTAMRYLEALRVEQTRNSKAAIRHLETERIERDGRPGYSLRDSMDVPSGTGGGVPLMQVARVFLDGTRGITITAMVMADDLPHLDAEIRAMMESIRFTAPPPRAPGEDIVP